MLVLDTNVISEIMRAVPLPRVMEWWSKQQSGELFTTTVTMAETLYGIEILPRGKRRDSLLAEAGAVFTQDFAGRILPFDEEAAGAFAKIAAGRRAKGRPIAELDAQIAAIARSRSATLATRNTADFEDCGIRLVDPWQPVAS
jgi:predicted nucleic acid-binding protein